MVSEPSWKKSLYSQNSATATSIEDYSLMLKNPKILKLVVLVHSLYIDIGEGSEAKMFTVQIKIHDEHCVKFSASYSLYSTRYDSSKLGFQPLPGFSLKQVT